MRTSSALAHPGRTRVPSGVNGKAPEVFHTL